MRIKTRVVTQSGRILRPAGAVFDVDDVTAKSMIADGRAEPADSAVLPVAGSAITKTGAPSSSSSGSVQHPDYPELSENNRVEGEFGEGTNAEIALEERKAELRAEAIERGVPAERADEVVALKLEYDSRKDRGLPTTDIENRIKTLAAELGLSQSSDDEEADFYHSLNADDAIAYVLDTEDVEGVNRLEQLELVRKDGCRAEVLAAMNERRQQLTTGST